MELCFDLVLGGEGGVRGKPLAQIHVHCKANQNPLYENKNLPPQYISVRDDLRPPFARDIPCNVAAKGWRGGSVLFPCSIRREGGHSLVILEGEEVIPL